MYRLADLVCVQGNAKRFAKMEKVFIIISIWEGVAMDCIQNLFPGKIFDVGKNVKAVSKNT
jgi:hypothetical protein